MEFHFAPLQGYTDWIYRNTYEKYFGGIDAYYTPFLRVESGQTFRNRDLRDLNPENNTVPRLIPQILPGSPEEFRVLAALVQKNGYTCADINMGCPFPMIAGKKKGAGILPYPDRVEEILGAMDEFPELHFSLKIRLGWENVCECIDLLNIINGVRLCHVTVHARIGKQQYKGSVDLEAFRHFYEACKHPVLYNGDLKTVEDIERIIQDFPLLRGVMMGRGVLSSPFLVKDFVKNETFSTEQRMSLLFSFHNALFSAYSGHLQGENQLLTKMKTLWDYLLPDTDRKLLKKIRKANKLTDYTSAVNMILHA